MPIELGGIKINRVHKIATLEEAAFIYHRIPGQEGSSVQNLGRNSVRLQIEGIFYGPKAKDELEKLRGVHIKRKPVDFIADVMGQTYTGKVTLDRFEVTESALEPQQFSYLLVISEYVQPPKTAASQAVVNNQIKLNAQAALTVATLPDALTLGSLPEVTNPFPPLKDALEPAKQASNALIGSVGALKKVFGI